LDIVMKLLKSLLAGAGLAVALCTALPQSAIARPGEGWVSTTIDGGSANLRSAPSTSAAVLGTLRNGSSFSIVNERFDGAGYRWYQVMPSPASGVKWLRADLVSFAAPLPAQPSATCDVAIAQAETRLTAVSNTQILALRPIWHGYTNGPADRPSGYSISLAGSGGANILASPVFMNAIAASLLGNCSTAGLISFSMGDTDSGYVNYGWLPERLVRPFQCKLGSGAHSGPVRWGESICL
jgi:hypothetical protein